MKIVSITLEREGWPYSGDRIELKEETPDESLLRRSLPAEKGGDTKGVFAGGREAKNRAAWGILEVKGDCG